MMHGLPIDIYDGFIVFNSLVSFLTCFNDQWEVPGKFGGAPGSIKDDFLFSMNRKVCSKCFGRFAGRSQIDLGALRDHLRDFLILLHRQNRKPAAH